MKSPDNVDLARLAAVIDRIVERMRPEAIWLFGSRAEGRARPDSDYEITRGLGVAVDVVPCTRSVFEEEKHEINTLPRAAFVRGRLLYGEAA